MNAPQKNCPQYHLGGPTALFLGDPPTVNTKHAPPTVNTVPPTVNSAPPTVYTLPPTVNSAPSTVNTAPPTVNVYSRKKDNLFLCVSSLRICKFCTEKMKIALNVLKEYARICRPFHFSHNYVRNGIGGWGAKGLRM